MEATMAKYAVTYGRADFCFMAEDHGLKTLFVNTEAEVKQLAKDFIQVIPDSLESYQKDIQEWTGAERLLITHQEDETFYFSAQAVQETKDFSEFNKFVTDFAIDSE